MNIVIKINCRILQKTGREGMMAALSDVQKSQLRRKYERLGGHAGGLPTEDRTLQQLSTQEIGRIFRENEVNPEKWPTLTDLEDYMRNIAQLRHWGYPAPL